MSSFSPRQQLPVAVADYCFVRLTRQQDESCGGEHKRSAAEVRELAIAASLPGHVHRFLERFFSVFEPFVHTETVF